MTRLPVNIEGRVTFHEDKMDQISVDNRDWRKKGRFIIKTHYENRTCTIKFIFKVRR